MLLSVFVYRRTAAGNMMDDYNYGNNNDSDGNVTGVSIRTGGGHRQWPTSSADIVEYDSSVATDTPALPQQQTQFLLPQQQQRQRTNKFSQRSGTNVIANSNANYSGKSSIMSAVTADDSANGHSKFKWKKRALYVFLACLLAVVVINLTLTLWFIRVTQFTSVITKCYICTYYFL